MGHLGHFADHGLDLLDHIVAARDGGAVGQLDIDEEGPLIFFRQEAGRRESAQADDAEAAGRDDHTA